MTFDIDGRRERLRHYSERAAGYGQMALRSVFTLNGAAIVALLAFMGSEAGRRLSAAALVPSFRLFVWGLVLSVLAMGLGYLNLVFHQLYIATPRRLWAGLINGTLVAGCLAALASLVVFVAAALGIADALAG